MIKLNYLGILIATIALSFSSCKKAEEPVPEAIPVATGTVLQMDWNGSGTFEDGKPKSYYVRTPSGICIYSHNTAGEQNPYISVSINQMRDNYDGVYPITSMLQNATYCMVHKADFTYPISWGKVTITNFNAANQSMDVHVESTTESNGTVNYDVNLQISQITPAGNM